MANTEMQQDARLLKQLFIPSYLSVAICALLTVIIMGAAGLSKLTSAHGWLAETLKTISESDHHLLQLSSGDGGDKLSLVLLFAFWACVGLVVYYVVVGLARSVAEVGEIGRELGYVNTSRRALITSVIGRLGIRILAAAGLFVALALFLKFAIPFAISVVEAGSMQASSILAIMFAAAIVLVTSHLVVIMARLTALRPRLFSATI
jgi:hypothetical protein